MASILSIALVLAAAGAPQPAGSFEATYLHSLSTTFGPLPFSDAGLSYDSSHGELYVTGDGPVRVFNASGMEVYSFGDAPEFGIIRHIAALEDGDLIAFGFRGPSLSLVRCTFRGEFIEEIVPRNVPPELSGVLPTMMRYRDGRIYLADMPGMRILVLDREGEYLTSYDVAEQIGEAPKRADLGLRGFSVDREGNMLFTIQPLFRAYVMSPAGDLQAFGQRGSAPGKFNIVGGITRDDAGYTYVADVLKSAVIVFDPGFQFVKEFGYRGSKPGGMAAPEEIVAGGGKLFVSNRARRGVAVFSVGAR